MVELRVGSEARYRTIAEDRIVAMLLLHGWTFELRTTARARAEREAAAALQGLVDKGLAWSPGPGGARLFDPVEALNFLRLTGLRGEDATLRDHCAPSARRLVRLAATNEAARYAVTIQRRFALTDREPGGKVRLRLPVPLRDATLAAVQTEVLVPDGLAVDVRRASDRIDAIVAVPAGGEVTLGIRAIVSVVPSQTNQRRPTLDAADASLYLRDIEGAIRVDDAIRALAERLAGAERDPWAVLRRLWAFLMDELACGALHYDRIDPSAPYRTALDDGWYDCRLGSALLAALCRARGIPARVVHGYLLYPTAPSIHTWTEAWIDGEGWRPFDLFSWDLDVRTGEADWRDRFFGRLDHRISVERPPRQFSGTGDVRLPPAWHMLTYADQDGTVVEFLDLETSALVYAESIAVERLSASAR